MAKEIRRFPPPWSIIESDESFTVIDATGFNLAYLYFAEGQRGFHMARLTRDEARRIANGIARLHSRGTRPRWPYPVCRHCPPPRHRPSARSCG